MRLIILHGNAQIALLEKTLNIKKEFAKLDIQEFSGQDKNVNQVLLEATTPQLFSDKRLVMVEVTDEKLIDLDKITGDENLTLVLKLNKQLNQSSVLLKSAQSMGGMIFNLSEKDETSIFPLLDDLAEKNSRGVYTKIEKLYEEFGFQYISTMIFYMFRRLIMPTKSLPPFVLKKIERQKANFTTKRLKELYKFACETDYKIKSGMLEEKTGLFRLTQEILA